MPDAPHLRPATADEIAEALSFALLYRGRKRVHHADDAMARITAERLVQHLEASGFVLMKGPPRGAPSTTGCRRAGDGTPARRKSRPPKRPGELKRGNPLRCGETCAPKQRRLNGRKPAIRL